jgi:hypothetical protein
MIWDSPGGDLAFSARLVTFYLDVVTRKTGVDMRMLDKILGRSLQSTGELGYFGLLGWWTSSFSAAERSYMEEAFCASGLPARAKPLTRDRGLVNYPTAASLLTVLADRLSEKSEDRGLAVKVLAQAEERALAEGDVLGRYFVYHQMIRLYCKWKSEFANAVDLIFAACHKQIQLAADASQALRKLRPDKPLPAHLGYMQASALLEQEGRLEPAIELCKQAQAEGWGGNWPWRIQRMARRVYERGNPVKSVSSSGITPV